MSQADSVPTLAEIPGTSEWIFVTKMELEANNSHKIFPFLALFGTDLEARMEHEKSIIPAIVTRCIQEVELRGLSFFLSLQLCVRSFLT
jgi:hypothetical protein